jgi:hypothetical protein
VEFLLFGVRIKGKRKNKTKPKTKNNTGENALWLAVKQLPAGLQCLVSWVVYVL